MTADRGQDNVIQMRPDAPERDAPLRKRPRDYTELCAAFCKRIELDGETERAYCSDCGKEVPLFKALEQLAADFERYITLRDAAKTEARHARVELDDLKRQIRNAKATLRRAAAKTA